MAFVTANSALAARWIQSAQGAGMWVDRTGELKLGCREATSGQLVEVDASRMRQKIDGFGGAFNELGWAAMSGLTGEERGSVMEALFGESGCRFNLCRMPMGASDFSFGYYSLNDHAGDYAMRHFSIDRDRVFLIPYIKEAMKVRPGLRVWGSPWSPPAWMKQSGNYKALGKGLTWDDRTLRAYALYFEKAVRAYQAEGLNFEAVHVQNEPWANQSFPSALWTGEQLRDFIRDYLGPRFRRNNVAAEIWLGTINAGGFDWTVRPTLEDPKAMAHVAGLGFQWGGKQIVGRCHALRPELPLMQTETECGDGLNTWQYAEHTASLFQEYLGAGVSSYLQWNMILDQEQRSYWGWPQNSMVTIMTHDQEHDSGDSKKRDRAVFNPQYFMVKHVTHFVDPGAHVVALAPGFDGFAFKNPDGRLIVFHYNRSDVERTLRIRSGSRQLLARVARRSFSTFVLSRNGAGP